MKQRVYDEVYAGCGAGKVRNPRTARCVRKRRPLGAAIHAAAQQLMQGAAVPACGARAAWDFAARECVADAPRVGALRALYGKWGLAAAANASGRNARNREARAAELEARAQELEARVLSYNQRLANGDQRLTRCQADLARARDKVRMVEAALLDGR